MILQGRQWPSIVPSRSGFISGQDFGDLAMDLPLDQAKARKVPRSLITFCQAGHYTWLHCKQDVFASGPVHRPLKSGLITEQTGPGPPGNSQVFQPHQHHFPRLEIQGELMETKAATFICFKLQILSYCCTKMFFFTYFSRFFFDWSGNLQLTNALNSWFFPSTNFTFYFKMQ